MSKISDNDYKYILNYYNKPIPNSKCKLKKNAESIVANKLCKCIKKIDKIYEARSIGICTRSVINKKGFIRGNFTCKNKKKITLYKGKRRKKTKKNKN